MSKPIRNGFRIGRIMQPEEIAAHTTFWLSEDSAPASSQIYEAEQLPVIDRR